MSRDKNRHLRLAGQPTDYQKLGIDPVEVVRSYNVFAPARHPPAGEVTALYLYGSTRALHVIQERRGPIEIGSVEHICRDDEMHGHQKVPQRFRVALVVNFGI
jgi:hypothetical protein